MKYNLFCTLAILLAQSVAGANNQPADRLPGFDHWELSFQLERSQPLRDALEVAPHQLAAIKEMRRDFSKKGGRIEQARIQDFLESSAKNRLASEKYREQLKSDPQLDESDLKRLVGEQRIQVVLDDSTAQLQRLALAIDEEVEAALKHILTEGQMKALLPTAMRAKYSSCFAPFSDPAVVSHCQIQEHLVAVKPIIEEAQVVYAREVERNRREAGRRLILFLPPERRQKMVNYLGNRYTPELACESGTNLLQEIPFPGIGNLDFVLHSPEISKELNITTAQRQSIEAIHREHSNAMQLGPRSGQARSDYTDHLSLRQHNAFLELLTPTQSLEIQRMIAFRRFDADFNAPFLHEDFMKYLDSEEFPAIKVQRRAALEEQNVRTAVGVLDAQVFDSLCQQLPPIQQRRMLETFNDIWSITISDPRRWSYTYPAK